MWRVLDNIFGNTVKYALDGPRVYVDLADLAGEVILSVKNISRDPLNIRPEELTERFVRGDQARNTEGSGLGLSIAKWIVDRHGGWFEVRSWPGVGPRMTIVLPVAELDAGGADEDAEQTRPA